MMTGFESAQRETIDALANLVRASDFMEKQAIQKALTELHDDIFSVSFESVYQKSRALLIELNEELEIAEEVL